MAVEFSEGSDVSNNTDNNPIKVIVVGGGHIGGAYIGRVMDVLKQPVFSGVQVSHLAGEVERLRFALRDATMSFERAQLALRDLNGLIRAVPCPYEPMPNPARRNWRKARRRVQIRMARRRGSRALRRRA